MRSHSDDAGSCVILQEVGGAGGSTVTPFSQYPSNSKGAVRSAYDAAHTRCVGSEQNLGRQETLLLFSRT